MVFNSSLIEKDIKFSSQHTWIEFSLPGGLQHVLFQYHFIIYYVRVKGKCTKLLSGLIRRLMNLGHYKINCSSGSFFKSSFSLLFSTLVIFSGCITLLFIGTFVIILYPLCINSLTGRESLSKFSRSLIFIDRQICFHHVI